MLGRFHKRQLALSAALLVTLIAAYFAPPEQADALVEVNKTTRSKTTNVGDSIDYSIKQSGEAFVGKRLWVTKNSQNLFPDKVKPLPVVPVVQAPLPLPKPTAPPLPFAYVGKVVEDGKPMVFVSKQQKNFMLKGGEVIEGTYRVDKVESGQVVFTYLPLAAEQVMTIGGKD